jgi:hypothetical protein
MTDSRPRKPPQPETIRCPYCVERPGLTAMIGQNGWYMCARCGHLALPAKPLFVCTCANCVARRIA